jgi:acetyl esterase/lipase
MCFRKTVKIASIVLALAALLLLLCSCSPRLRSHSFLVDGNILVESDLIYKKIDDIKLELDMATPKGKGPFPTLIYIFGNGWGHWSGGKSLYYPNILQAARRGYVAVAIDYRLTSIKVEGRTRYLYPAQINDAKAAVRWLRANSRKYKIDPSKIGAIGFSSGGHLSLLLGLTSPEDGLEGDFDGMQYSSRVQAVISSSGPTDLRRDPRNPESEAAILELIGGSLKEFPEMYTRASPITFVKSDSPPVLLIHGSEDNEVPLEQANLLDEALKRAGVPHELIIMKVPGHQDFTMDPKVLDFMDNHLKMVSK